MPVIQNVIMLIVILGLAVELYFCAAGAAHRKAKLLKGWNPVKGKVLKTEKKYDSLMHRHYMEISVETGDGRVVTAKLKAMFCIYEEGEEVDLMEKDGVHRFRGNDRVDRRGKREQRIGLIPVLTLILISIVLQFL